MLKTTFISRASDGLILCETYDSSSSQQSKYNIAQHTGDSSHFEEQLH